MFHIKIHNSVLVPLLGTIRIYFQNPTILINIVSSLGLAYAGTNRDDVIELISNALREGNPSMEV